MKTRSLVLQKLAEFYENSAAGRHGTGTRDVQPGYEELLALAGCAEGEAREVAESDLRAAADAGLVKLEPIHRRDPRHFAKVRLSPANEQAFFDYIARESPTQRRHRWSDLFHEAQNWPVTPRFAGKWRNFCEKRAERALPWSGMEPFRVHSFREGRHLLETTLRLLAWESPNDGSLIRWVSSHLCGHSKTLETAQRSRELLLREASGGRIASFESHDILSMPREARIAGPLRLRIAGRAFDCAAQEVATLSLSDLQRAELVACDARRCLTVENKTVFLDLARKRSGDIIIWTSFPNAATLALLARLPDTLEFHHFGDTDPAGFHILHDLCARSARPFRPFRMKLRAAAKAREITASERDLLRNLLDSPHLAESRAELHALAGAKNVGAFEQEDHQPAPLPHWPFFAEA